VATFRAAPAGNALCAIIRNSRSNWSVPASLRRCSKTITRCRLSR